MKTLATYCWTPTEFIKKKQKQKTALLGLNVPEIHDLFHIRTNL